MQSGVTCNAGDLLSYKKGGFVLADNSSEDMTSNICLAIGNSQTNNSVSVLDVGKYELEDSSHDGDICYVGVNGKMIFDISVKPKYVRKVGHVEGNQLIFNDSQITIMS
jgi:co-chaperonin GroES (HSP10)